jgi:hypothetical protein
MKIEPDHTQMTPGDLLEYRCPRFGVVWQWQVHGIYCGTTRQDGLIEVSPVMAEPGSDARKAYPTSMVPEPMTRNLTLVKISDDLKGGVIVHTPQHALRLYRATLAALEAAGWDVDHG